MPVVEIDAQKRAEPFLETAAVTIIAQKVVVGREESEPSADEQRRIFVNSVLLAVFAGMVTFWCWLHLKTFLTGTIILGTATLWSAFQAILAMFKPWKGEADALRKRLLAHAETSWHLCFFIALALLSFLATSSVHVGLGDGVETPVRIRVTEGGSAGLIPRIDLDDYVKRAGAAMFSQFRSRHLQLQVQQPAGYHVRQVVIRPGEPKYLTFPQDFEKETVVRIYVPYGLMDRIPAAGADKQEKTDLIVSDGIRSFVIGKFGGVVVYVGLRDAAAAKGLVERGRSAFEKAQHEQLDGRADAAEIANYLAELRARPIVRSEWDLNKTDTVTARVSIDGKTVMKCSARVEETRINDCMMTEM